MKTKRVGIDRHQNAGIGTYCMLIAFSLFILFPFAWMLVTSLKTLPDTFSVPPRWIPRPVSLQAFINIWSNYPLFYYFRNSFIIVFFSTFICIVVSCLAGYAASRTDSKLKDPFLTFLLVLQMFPAVMLLVPYYKMLTTFGMINTLQGLVLPNIAFTMPFCTWMLMGYFNTIPRELEQSASIDGCNKLQCFIKIILPLAIPGIAATCIYSFIQVWNCLLYTSDAADDLL